MVQVLSARQPKQTFAQKLNAGIGRGLETAGNMLSEHKKETEKLAEKTAVKNKFGEDISNLPKDLQKVSIENDLKGQKEQKDQLAFNTFADKLEASHPGDKKYKGIADIYRSNLPSNEKSNLVKAMTGHDMYKDQQQQRLLLDSILRRYNNRITEIVNEMKTVKFPTTLGKEKFDQLQKMKGGLQLERDKLLGFKYLNNLADDEEDITGASEGESMDTPQEEGELVQFDPSNEEHKAEAKALMAELKNKEKVRQELSKKYKGV